MTLNSHADHTKPVEANTRAWGHIGRRLRKFLRNFAQKLAQSAYCKLMIYNLTDCKLELQAYNHALASQVYHLLVKQANGTLQACAKHKLVKQACLRQACNVPFAQQSLIAEQKCSL